MILQTRPAESILLILGIDPGDMTGFARVKRLGPGKIQLLEIGEIYKDKFHSWVKSIEDVDIIVCEDFIKRPDIANNEWLKLDTAKKIGSTQQRAYDLECIYVEFQPWYKPAGYRAAKLTYTPGKKGTHIQDATAHACLLASAGYSEKQRIKLD